MNAAVPTSIPPRKTITPFEIMRKYSIRGPETLAVSRPKATRGVKMRSTRNSNKFSNRTKSSTKYDNGAITIHEVEDESNESTEVVEIDYEVYQDHHLAHHHVSECSLTPPSSETNDDDPMAMKIQMEEDAFNNNVVTITKCQEPPLILAADTQEDMNEDTEIVTQSIDGTCNDDQEMVCSIPEISMPMTFTPPSEPSSQKTNADNGSNRKRPDKWANFFLGKPRKKKLPTLKSYSMLDSTETPEGNLAYVILRIEFQEGGLFHKQRQGVRDMVAKEFKIYQKDPNDEKHQQKKFLRLRFFRPEDKRARHYDYLDVFRLPPFDKFENDHQLLQAIDNKLLGESASGGDSDRSTYEFESDDNLSNSVASNTSSSSTTSSASSSSDDSWNLRLNTVDSPSMTGVCDSSSYWDLIPDSDIFCS